MTQVCWHHPYTVSREWCPSDGWSWCLALELCLPCLQQVLSKCAVTAYKAQQLHLPLADIWGHWLQLALQIQGWAESGSSFPVPHPASSRLHTPSTCCLRFPPSPWLSCIYSQTQPAEHWAKVHPVWQTPKVLASWLSICLNRTGRVAFGAVLRALKT